MYVASGSNDKVFRYDTNTGLVDEFASTTTLFGPTGITFGPTPDDDLYVASLNGDSIIRLQGPNDPSHGTVIETFVTSAGSGGLDRPDGITFGPDGNLYVASSSTNQVLRYQGPNAGSPGTFISIFVTANSGTLDIPHGLEFGQDGNLYVASFNSKVLRYDGTTGAFMDEFVPPGAGGLVEPFGLTFAQRPVTPTVPDPIDDLTIPNIFSTQLDLSWSAPFDGNSPITGYRIDRESPIGGGFTVIVLDTGSPSTTFPDPGLMSSTEYNYRVFQ